MKMTRWQSSVRLLLTHLQKNFQPTTHGTDQALKIKDKLGTRQGWCRLFSTAAVVLRCCRSDWFSKWPLNSTSTYPQPWLIVHPQFLYRINGTNPWPLIVVVPKSNLKNMLSRNNLSKVRCTVLLHHNWWCGPTVVMDPLHVRMNRANLISKNVRPWWSV